MNPQQLTTTTATVDSVFLLIAGICVAMLVLITGLMVYFVVRYHHRRHPRPTSEAQSNIPLEIAWTVLPTLLVLVMFYYGWAGYLALRNVPENALEVHSSARMFSWSFTYPNGRISDKLYVPVGEPVKVTITSEDVVHGFYIPAFRIKRDAVPGMDTHVWFVASESGSYHLFCAEYCGVGHAAMITTVEALPAAEFRAWLEKPPDDAQPEGLRLLQQHGCIGCHSLDGTAALGPSFQGLWGRQVTVLSAGRERTLTADRDYLIHSIVEPNADIVKGFPPVMPSYQGRLSEQELEQIVEFLRELP